MNSHRAAAGLLVLCAAACGGGARLHNVLLPPHLNLVPYGAVGLVTFTAENAKGLNEFATRRFEEYVLAAQTGIEMRDFPRADSVQVVGVAMLGPERGVPVVFLGHLKISNVKPSGGLFGIASGHIEATVSAELSVELHSTTTGGTLWRSTDQSPDLRRHLRHALDVGQTVTALVAPRVTRS